jgi:hypothetical protein
MKAADTKQQASPNLAPPPSQHDDGLDTDWGGVFYPLTPRAALDDEWRPGFWDALVGYWGYIDPDRLRDPELEARMHRSSDDEDFSSEHGYESDLEGRSEFEHGDFERWL